MGTNDDLFVRNDVPLVEEAGDPSVKNLALHDELTVDEREEEHKFGSKEMRILQLMQIGKNCEHIKKEQSSKTFHRLAYLNIENEQ